MKQPLVSIITVVYNGEQYLQQTIDSVKNQSYANIEYLIIDGGSSDSTLDIVKENKRVISQWISEPDQGLYDAMNKGIKMAKGELIGMINSDDWYEYNAVEIMVNAYIENPRKTIFHADRFDVDFNGKKSLRKFNSSKFKFLYYGMTYNHPSMFITKQEYQKHIYNINLKALSDYQFILETFLRNQNSLFYVNKGIVNYRLEGVSTQMDFYNMLKEGFVSRRLGGLSLLQSLFSLFFRGVLHIIFTIKNILK